MPNVVGYWRLPEEEPPFLDHLEESGKVLAVHRQNTPSPEALTPRPVREVVMDDPQAVLLLLAEHRDLLTVIPFQKDGAIWYGIHAMKSPVIDYLRGRWYSPGRLGQSNIASYANYPDERGTRLIPHPERYVDWGKRAAKWVRKSTPFFYRYKNYRITALVNEQLKNGIELVP